MNRKRICIAIAVLLIGVMTAPAIADRVVLKTGKAINVESVWQEKNQIWFRFHGLKASVPKNEVIKIERNSSGGNQHLSHKAEKKVDLKALNADSSLKTAPAKMVQPANRVLPPRESAGLNQTSHSLRKDGFGDLQWGAIASSIAGLQKTETQQGLPDVIECVRPQDRLQLGDAALTSIVYTFWRDRLYTVTIWVQGQSDFDALRDLVTNQFGQGHPSDRFGERYLWTETPSEMMLEYLKDTRLGMLWLRSREIGRQYKLAKLNGPSSYLKWTESPTTRTAGGLDLPASGGFTAGDGKRP